jgi:hypothetical protein
MNQALLERLSRMTLLREAHADNMNEAGQRFLRRCLWAAFDDCCQVGARREALRILEGG